MGSADGSGVWTIVMRPEVRVLGGLALMTAGAASLIAMNIWTVPTLETFRPSDVGTASLPVPSKLPRETVDPVPSVKQPDAPSAAESAAPEPSVEPTKTVTTQTSDGTELPSIRFEPQSRVLSSEMMKQVDPIGAYLRHNFGMKVVLTGHGDEGMEASEYVRLGRLRSAAVLRLLVDYGVSAARIGIEVPEVEADRVLTKGVPGGAVEMRIEPRFVQPKKGESDGP
jgi:outer membrane protein OmpA-like peptidoglycan-associated protein